MPGKSDTKLEQILSTLSGEDRALLERRLKAASETAPSSSTVPPQAGVRELLSASRKPPVYNPDNMEIDRFFRTFENYVLSLGLPDQAKRNTFRSYLSEDMLARIDQAVETEEDDMS